MILFWATCFICYVDCDYISVDNVCKLHIASMDWKNEQFLTCADSTSACTCDARKLGHKLNSPVHHRLNVQYLLES